MSSSFTALPAGVDEQLPVAWKDFCVTHGTSCFAWAHDGSNARSSWVQLLADGKLVTKWGKGTWKSIEGQDMQLELKFGGVRHICELRGDGKFEVLQRIRGTTGETLPHPKILSAGWPIQELPALTKTDEANVVTPPRKRRRGAAESPPTVPSEAGVESADSAPDRKRQRIADALTPAAQGFNVFHILARAQRPKERTPKAVMSRLKTHYQSLSADEQRQHSDTFKALMANYLHALRACREEKATATASPSESPETPDVADTESPLPKKPAGGAYGVFCKEMRPKILAEAATKTERSLPAVAKAIGAMWGGLDAAQRQVYDEQYQMQKQAYDAAVMSRNAVHE